MPILVNCPSCGRKLRAPDTAAGKKLKCPSCGDSIPVPAGGSVQAAPVPVAEAVPVSDPEQERRACPFCGEMILATAKKCRFCGELLDVTLRAAEEARRHAEEARRIASQRSGPANVFMNAASSSAAASSAAASSRGKRSKKNKPAETAAGCLLLVVLLSCCGYAAEWGHRVVLHCLPTYAPDTNPIERVWWRLHEAVTRNHRCHSMVELLDLTFDWFATRTHFRVKSAVYCETPEK